MTKSHPHLFTWYIFIFEVKNFCCWGECKAHYFCLPFYFKGCPNLLGLRVSPKENSYLICPNPNYSNALSENSPFVLKAVVVALLGFETSLSSPQFNLFSRSCKLLSNSQHLSLGIFRVFPVKVRSGPNLKICSTVFPVFQAYSHSCYALRLLAKSLISPLQVKEARAYSCISIFLLVLLLLYNFYGWCVIVNASNALVCLCGFVGVAVAGKQ